MNVDQKIIFHIDGDAFFASCEQSTQMSLRGVPIAVGRERGIATAFSYEAKALGITRGMKGSEIIRDFPEVKLVASDYRKYGLFSKRFKNIVRTYTRRVEGMSIDECYADMSDVVHDFAQAERMAHIMQNELNTKLGMTFSIGVGPNKTIAKIASGMNKPCGVTVVATTDIEKMLHHKSIATVSGIGYRSEGSLNKHQIYTIGDFANKSTGWVSDYCAKPYRELYRELQGDFTKALELHSEKPKSISKIRAFAPASADREKLLSEFVRNAEIVAKKMHQQNVQGKTLSLGMKLPKIPGTGIKEKGTELFRVSIQITPESPLRYAQDIIDCITKYFDELYVEGHRYRATYVGVYGLRSVDKQLGLFRDEQHSESQDTLAELTADLERQYGRSVLHRGISLSAMNTQKPIDITSDTGTTGTPLIASKEGNKVLEIPYLGLFS